MRIRFSLFLLLLLGILKMKGQGVNQGINQSTQYTNNLYLINPAYAGAEKYTSIQSGYKRNWTGISNGPNSFYISAHSNYTRKGIYPINQLKEMPASEKEEEGNSLPARSSSSARYIKERKQITDSISNAQSKVEKQYQKEVKEYKRRQEVKPIHGFGFNIYNETSGPTSRTGAYLTYALHLVLNKSTKMSLGASLGMYQNSISLNTIYFKDQNDPLINGSPNLTRINPDVNLGAFLYRDDYFIAVSAYSVIPNSSKLVKTDYQSPNVPCIYMVQAGYKINLDKEFSVLPSLWGRFININNFSYDVNVMVNYKTVHGGITYRKASLLAFIIGINILSTIDVNYSYDYSISNSSNFNTYGGHELQLGYRLSKKNGSVKSRMFN